MNIPFLKYFQSKGKAQNEEKRSGQYDYSTGIPWLQAISSSGVAVTPETALNHATVFICCKIIAESTASLPLKLHRSLPTGGSEIAYQRPEHRLMAVAPSELYTSYSFRAAMQFILCMRGNAYARIIRDGRGTVRELRILHPDSVRPYKYKNKLYYQVNEVVSEGYESENLFLDASEVLHIATVGTDGIRGRSVITELRDRIGVGLAASSYAGKNMKEGTLRGILKSDKKLDKDGITSVRTNFRDAMSEGRIPLLENGLDFASITLAPADAEFINTVKINRQDIYGAYRVPAHMTGDLERSTNNNIEHQGLEFQKYCLLPHLTMWEQELNRKIIQYSLQGEYYYSHNVEGLLRGDYRTRMDTYAKAVQWGILNRDEVRAIEGLAPIPDGEGAMYLTPLNMVPISEQFQKKEDE
jgi:HK97 family phage portal protein